jgi:hypothetical protein
MHVLLRVICVHVFDSLCGGELIRPGVKRDLHWWSTNTRIDIYRVWRKLTHDFIKFAGVQHTVSPFSNFPASLSLKAALHRAHKCHFWSYCVHMCPSNELFCLTITSAFIILCLYVYLRMWQWQCNLLWHYSTSQKVAYLIPDEVIGLLIWPNPSSRTMASGSTHSLTEINTRRRRFCHLPESQSAITCERAAVT